MKNRTVAAGVIAAVLIVAVWWLFVFSPVRGNTSKVGDDITAAKSDQRGLETKVKQLEDLERRAPEIKADRDRLRQAVPAQPELATFIESANQLATDTGVTWVSVSPTQPTATTASGTVPLAITVEGGYYEVLGYLNRLENMSRLVVVDELSLNAAENKDGGEPTLTANLTGRMFDQGNAAAAPAGATTPTSVTGGGGVAATPQQGS